MVLIRHFLLAPLLLLAVAADDGGGPARYDAGQKLLFPADYRQWVFLSSGHGMTYGPAAQADGTPMFDNVFVNREAHEAFLKSGHWPEGTMFALEVRGASSHGSINKGGAFQAGDPVAVEVHVKDSHRFKTGWAFFSFQPGGKPAEMIPASASCYSCHRDHAAVDTTFVQFYPTLLPTATKAGTLSAGYLADERGSEKQP